MDVNSIQYMLTSHVVSEGIKSMFFKSEIFRVAFKVLSSGFGVFVLKNYTKFLLKIQIKLRNYSKIQISTNHFLL